jgi:DNA-directed RNA polymerase subunit RPC12/RpoP
VIGRLLSWVASGVARVASLPVCAACVRESDEIIDEDKFGDYAACGRCGKPKTSKDAVYYVMETKT